MSIGLRTAVQSVIALLAFGLLLFVPAGTLDYWEAWGVLAVFTIAMLYSTVYLVRKDPAVVERRMRAGPKAETRPVPKVVAASITILYCAQLVVSAARPIADRRRAGGDRAWHRDIHGQPKQLCGGQHHRGGEPEGGLHRSVRARATPHVYGGIDHVGGYSACPRLLLGTGPSRPRGDRVCRSDRG